MSGIKRAHTLARFQVLCVLGYPFALVYYRPQKKNAGLLEWAVGLITSGASRPGAVNNSSVYSIPNKLHRGLQHRGHELLHITAQATAVWILVSIFTFQPNCLGESGFTQ